MKRPLYVVATEDEKARFVPVGEESIVTGVGYANVFDALKSVPRDRQIINIGYAGSNKIPVGKLCNIAVVENYHPNASYESDKIYILEDDGVINGYVCYTSNDFVTKTSIQDPCVFDMELYAICAMGFSAVKAKKLITDNLSARQYKDNTGVDVCNTKAGKAE